MGCCEATNPDFEGAGPGAPTGTSWRWPPADTDVDRRTAVKGMLAATGALAIGGPALGIGAVIGCLLLPGGSCWQSGRLVA